MTTSRLTPEEIRSIIVQTAKKQFLENGIAGTEMKEIATLSKLSRSTLYRYAIDRSQLAFIVSTEVLTELCEKCFSLMIPSSANGFEKLSQFTYHFIDALCDDIDKVSYLTEFDCLFRGAYPDIPEARKYIDTINRMLNRTAQFLFEGMADGSIRQVENPLFFTSVLVNTFWGIGQRVLPRDSHYEEEHHATGRKLMVEATTILLNSIANTETLDNK